MCVIKRSFCDGNPVDKETVRNGTLKWGLPGDYLSWGLPGDYLDGKSR